MVDFPIRKYKRLAIVEEEEKKAEEDIIPSGCSSSAAASAASCNGDGSVQDGESILSSYADAGADDEEEKQYQMPQVD